MATFAQFGTADLDRATLLQLERGRRSTEILKQSQYLPVSMENQVMILYAVTNGYLDDVPVDRIKSAEESFYKYMQTTHPDIGKAIASEKTLTDDIEEKLKKAAADFKQTVSADLPQSA